MPKPLIDSIIFWPLVAIFIVIIFIAGFFLTKQSIDIGGCKAEWSLSSVASSECPGSNRTFNATCQGKIIISPDCPKSNQTYNATCLIQSYVEQHNAITSAILCACNKAQSGSEYPDQQLNGKIIEVYGNLYGSSPSVQEVCESSVLIRIK